MDHGFTMTHPNFVTNGASLEDCHTNFFALVSSTLYYYVLIAAYCEVRAKDLGMPFGQIGGAVSIRFCPITYLKTVMTFLYIVYIPNDTRSAIF